MRQGVAEEGAVAADEQRTVERAGGRLGGELPQHTEAEVAPRVVVGEPTAEGGVGVLGCDVVAGAAHVRVDEVAPRIDGMGAFAAAEIAAVGAPFPGVADHVEQAERVGLPVTDRPRP